MSTFERALEQAIQIFGLEGNLKPQQKDAISGFIEEKKDSFVVLPTGYGKSLCFFLLPLILDLMFSQDCFIIIISPLRWLIESQLQLIHEKNLKAINLTQHKEGMDLTNVKYIFTTPETLISPKTTLLQSETTKQRLKGFIMDEAHCILNWGDSFRPSYSKLMKAFDKTQNIRKMALTATASDETIKKISQNLKFQENFKTTIVREQRHNIKIIFKKTLQVNQQLNALLDELYSKLFDTPKTLVFCPQLKLAAHCYNFFKYYSTDDVFPLFQSFMSTTEERTKRYIIENFMKPDSRIRILFATNAFGMGIDVQGIVRVIHILPPRTLDDYIQQIGRAGRANERCEAEIYFNTSKKDQAEEFKVPIKTSKEMKEFLEIDQCRREYIAEHYHLEKRNLPPRECCDWCEENRMSDL